jgi:hypothetical protein
LAAVMYSWHSPLKTSECPALHIIARERIPNHEKLLPGACDDSHQHIREDG